jgi:hypothetical protein
MKRVLPNPEQVHRPGPRPVAVEQPSLPSLPLEILENIFEFLEFKDTCRALQTYRDLYYPVRINNPFWEKLFLRHFPSSRIVPEQSWMKECETQNRLMSNIIAGRCTIRGAQVEMNHGVSCFTKGENGCLIICFKNGAISNYDLKTGKSDVLQLSPNPNDAFRCPKKVVCQGGLYAVEWEREVRVWELATGNNIFSFKSKGEGYLSQITITRMELMDGRLLIEESPSLLYPPGLDRPNDEPACTIQIFDLKSKSAQITLPLSSSPLAVLLHGKTLYCAIDDLDKASFDLLAQRIDFWDLETKTCQTSLNVNFPPDSVSFEMSLFAEKTLFLFCKDSNLILEYDLANPLQWHNFPLWKAPGIPFGFCKEQALVRSTKNLSFLFDKCFSEQFAYWTCSARDGNAALNFRINQASKKGSWSFNQGILSFLSITQKQMFFLDFAASKEELLGRIVEMLEKKDPAIAEQALTYLERMPESVQAAIQKIYKSRPVFVEDEKSKGSLPMMKREELNSAAALKQAIEAMGTQRNSLALIQQMLAGLENARDIASAPQEETYEDLEGLKESILHYLLSIQSP